ncbi:hypothetical protein MRX96_023422 [Rhipicephalus microplus]
MNDSTISATASSTVTSPAGSNEAAFPYSPQYAQLRPRPPFDFENPGSWSTFLLQYEDYSYAARLYAAEQQVQVRSLPVQHGSSSQGLVSVHATWRRRSSRLLSFEKDRQ